MKAQQQIVHAARWERQFLFTTKTTTAACGKNGVKTNQAVIYGGPITCPECIKALSYSLKVTGEMARKHPEVFEKTDYYTLGAAMSPQW